MSKPYLDAFRTLMENALPYPPEAVGLKFRAMFGGVGVYAHGQMFASLSNAGLALKLSPQAQTALLQEDGAKRLQYEPTDPPSKHYIVLPQPILNDHDLLASWIRQSIDHVQTLPAKPAKKKK